MPIPLRVGHFNKLVTNRITGKLAARLPGFGVLTHTGRKSGRRYRTPLNVFQQDGKYIVALTYGPDTDWVRNVLAEGGGMLETRGRTIRLSRPRLFHDPNRRTMPTHVRLVLGLIKVYDFLELTPEPRIGTANNQE